MNIYTTSPSLVKKILLGSVVVLCMITGVIFVNPTSLIRAAEEIRIQNDINKLLNAIQMCQIDNRGTLSKCGFAEIEKNKPYILGTGKENIQGYSSIDLCVLVSKAYINKMPINTNLKGWVAEGVVDTGAAKKTKYYNDCDKNRDYYGAYALFIDNSGKVSVSGVSRVNNEVIFTVIRDTN